MIKRKEVLDNRKEVLDNGKEVLDTRNVFAYRVIPRNFPWELQDLQFATKLGMVVTSEENQFKR